MLERTIAAIREADLDVAAAARRRHDSLTKPPGSLGRLEEVAIRVCAAQRTLRPAVARRAVLVFAADHGVVAEGVSAYPQAVTAQMVASFAAGGAAVCALTRAAGAQLVVVDVGVATPCAGALARRVRAGTANFTREPAMTVAEARAAIEVGIEIATAVPADVIAVGEMGIGNSTAAAAITAALCGASPERVTGRGTGVDEAGLAHKRAVVARALALHRPPADDAIAVLAAVGGLEIAACAGAYLGAAAAGKIAVLDGFISTAAAALAALLAPALGGYLVAGHRSPEPGHGLLLARLGLSPLLDLGMRLGEASGAALALPILGGAIAAFTDMATLEAAGVEDRVR
jgi:nicotinate-nucleotide--dimethylbenzimidazole phosphoribosyltransferase